MKKSTLFALLGAVIYTIVGCTAGDDQNGMVPQQPLHLRVVAEQQEYVATRAVIPNDNKIYNAVVMVFSPSDELFSIKTYNGAGVDSIDIQEVVVGLDLARHYVIYVAANMGHSTLNNANDYRKYFNFVATESDAYYHYRAINTSMNPHVQVSTIYGMPMSGRYTTTGLESGTVHIRLERIVSKVTYKVNLTGEAASTLDILGVRFCNVPQTGYLFGHPTDIVGGYISSDWFEPSADGLSASGTVYLFENRKGEGPDKNEHSNTIRSPEHATYMEVLLDHDGTQYFCKVYLGANATTNYDLKRNCLYNVSVNITGIDNMEVDMRRVKKVTDEWYATSGLMLHYDGIYNNGRGNARMTNFTTKTATDDPGYLSWHATNGYPAYTPPVTYDTPETKDVRNRWKNIAPATEKRFNLVLSRFNYPKVVDPADGWGPDCLIFGGNNGVASLEYDNDSLRPQQFTIEVIFRSEPGLNKSTEGNDLFGFLADIRSQPFVIAGVEAYDVGFGLIAGSKWNGLNYAAFASTALKRSIVIQYDGMYLTAFYGNKRIYREQKWRSGDLVWPTAPVGSNGKTLAATCAQLALGKFFRNDPVQYYGRIYSFRFYNRVLTEQERTDNFNLDSFRFGLPEPE